MRAAFLTQPQAISQNPLTVENVPMLARDPQHVLLRVRACGVCRTDLHIVEGELPQLRPSVIPGHQIVGEIVEGGSNELPAGTRVGVSWIGGVDGSCVYCRHGLENLCDSPTFTGYTVNGGFAEYATARRDFVFPLPSDLDDLHAAPLLCAGALVSKFAGRGVAPGERVGLFGFGSSAHLLSVLQAWGCPIYVSTRGESHRKLANELGATWVGRETDRPPIELDRAVTFAPSECGGCGIGELAKVESSPSTLSIWIAFRNRLRPPAVESVRFAA
jgi:propanol-preferring alcohol dehydrogenase